MAVEPSPDALLLQEFANTRDLRTFVLREAHSHRDGALDGGRDALESAEASYGWLVDRGLLGSGIDLGETDHARVLDLRAGLRAALDRTRPDQQGSRPPFEVPVRLALDPQHGPRLLLDDGVDEALGRICAAALRTTVTGEWWRLRVCGADDCHWVLYDQSKPGRARYCAPGCGNRVKTRAYRRRKAQRGPA